MTTGNIWVKKYMSKQRGEKDPISDTDTVLMEKSREQGLHTDIVVIKP